MADEKDLGFKDFSSKKADGPSPAPEPVAAADEKPAEADKPEVVSPVPAVTTDAEKKMPDPATLNDVAQGLVNNGMDVAQANSMTGPGSNI